jgi:hypothetical protein
MWLTAVTHDYHIHHQFQLQLRVPDLVVLQRSYYQQRLQCNRVAAYLCRRWHLAAPLHTLMSTGKAPRFVENAAIDHLAAEQLIDTVLPRQPGRLSVQHFAAYGGKRRTQLFE